MAPPIGLPLPNGAVRRACRDALRAGRTYELLIDGGALLAQKMDGLRPFVVIDPGGLHFACRTAAEASRVFVLARDARNYGPNERMARFNAERRQKHGPAPRENAS